MEIEITKMSSKGQVVIPRGIRDKLQAKEGSFFAVFSSDDTLVLKRIEMPEKKQLIKELGEIAREGRKRAEELGLKESMFRK